MAKQKRWIITTEKRVPAEGDLYCVASLGGITVADGFLSLEQDVLVDVYDSDLAYRTLYPTAERLR